MAESRRDEFSAKTKRKLAERAGFACSFPGCHRPTSGPSAEANDASVNLGEACHISAASSGPGARRYDPSLSSSERSSIDNGVWMCRDHGKLIDSDEATYTTEKLRQWKREAEMRADQGLRDPLPPETANPRVVVNLRIKIENSNVIKAGAEVTGALESLDGIEITKLSLEVIE